MAEEIVTFNSLDKLCSFAAVPIAKVWAKKLGWSCHMLARVLFVTSYIALAAVEMHQIIVEKNTSYKIFYLLLVLLTPVIMAVWLSIVSQWEKFAESPSDTMPVPGVFLSWRPLVSVLIVLSIVTTAWSQATAPAFKVWDWFDLLRSLLYYVAMYATTGLYPPRASITSRVREKLKTHNIILQPAGVRS